MKRLPTYDEIHCISDLHLGGKPGFQIFGSSQELCDLIKLLTTQTPKKHIALVINGDFIDFLAEEPSTHFDPDGAIAKLERIVLHDANFKPVFDALKAFAAKPRRKLVINLGNHDLELALPWVRAHLLDLLAGDDSAARGRIELIADGTGFACQVGQASVLCVHGNEVDSWNVADFERIRRVGRDLQFGQPVDAWIPNAGTQLVIDVMNDIKKKYPFVDLLKPEKEAVVPILLALNPEALNKLRGIMAAVGRMGWDAVRGGLGFLGEGDDGREGALATASPRAALHQSYQPFLVGQDGMPQVSSDDLMAMVEREARLGTDPMALVRSTQYETLGFWSGLWSVVRGKPLAESLREALDGLDKDRSFDFAAEDDTFKDLDKMVAADIDFVIAGHTHLARALKRKSGKGWYFNSGTWARLIQISADVRRDAKRFAQLVELFKDGTMDKLDAHPGLVVKRCTVVSVWADGPRTHGQLQAMTSAAPGPRLQPLDGTRFTKEA